MYVVIETNSWCDDEGAFLFDSFKNAFDYLASRFNPVFEGWEEDRINKICNVKEKHSNMNKPLTDDDRQYLEERGEDDQLAYWCTDSENIWSNGIHLSLYKIQNV